MRMAEQSAEKTLILTRVFAAPRALVFKAWVEPERAARWWGPQGFTTLSCRMDVRPGGAWRLQMRSPQGTIHTKCGVYREIEPPERLVFSYAWEGADGVPGHETLVTLRFEDHGFEETKMTLHQAVFDSPAACRSHRDGWTSCLERFAAWLEAG
jgi:uncharacterized protein YndB with AHSA1/START domain